MAVTRFGEPPGAGPPQRLNRPATEYFRRRTGLDWCIEGVQGSRVNDGVAPLAQAQRLGEQRCSETLDFVESKRLADGSCPPLRSADGAQSALACGLGGANRRRMNPWASARAVVVLHTAGRCIVTDALADGGGNEE
jgi:hypothetical protein